MAIIAILILAIIWSHDLIERKRIMAEQTSIFDAINSSRAKHLRFMAQAERNNQ